MTKRLEKPPPPAVTLRQNPHRRRPALSVSHPTPDGLHWLFMHSGIVAAGFAATPAQLAAFAHELLAVVEPS